MKKKNFQCQCTKHGHGHGNKMQKCKNESVREFHDDNFDLWLCETCLPFYELAKWKQDKEKK